MGNKPTIAISHLGCEKNRIDSEHMLGLLVQAGYEVDADETSADYVIVNTCSFIDAAREESIRTLVELAEADKKIVITGCMAQHFQEQLLAEIPEAVAVVGSGDYHKIVDVLERSLTGERVVEVSPEPTYIADEHTPRYRTTTEGVAYLRVAEGCDYACAFCIIPHLRGKQRSRTIESIIAEAQRLADEGVKELVLISQITTNYGLDIYGKPKLAELLRALGKVDIPWIRMHYAYPTGLTPQVIAAMQETANVLPYLDLPLQHSHPEILRAMNRPWQGAVNDRIIEQLKIALPDAVMRTTLIVAFLEKPTNTTNICNNSCNGMNSITLGYLHSPPRMEPPPLPCPTTCPRQSWTSDAMGSWRCSNQSHSGAISSKWAKPWMS
jgi:ribosomal protein S12 methylthiotransferase